MQADPAHPALAANTGAAIPARARRHAGQFSNSFIWIQGRRPTANGLDAHLERGDEGRNMPGPCSGWQVSYL